MSLILQDASSGLWSVTVDDLGALHTASVGSGSPSTPILNDPGNSTSWTLGITTLGALKTTSTTFGATNPTYIRLLSASGLTAWILGISVIGAINTKQAALGFEEDSFGVTVGAVAPSIVSVW